MKRPEMIIFDYGHTLFYEPDTDFLRGERALFKHITRNPRRVSAAYAFQTGNKIYKKAEKVRKLGFEIHEHQLLRLKYGNLGIRFGLSWEEAEKILWDNASPSVVMPFAEMILDYLEARGIRKGIISNIGWSGKALSDRVNALLPPRPPETDENEAPETAEAPKSRFEFILTSSEYGVRKPDRLLFETALKKAKLPPEKVWYCGDNIETDIYGAYGAGMFPVLYEDRNVRDERVQKYDSISLDIDFMYIRDWRELISILETTEE